MLVIRARPALRFPCQKISLVPMLIKKIEISDPEYQQERQLRNQVLLRPIGMADFSFEAFDKESLHFIAQSPDLGVVGCALLLPTTHEDGLGKLLQMAVAGPNQGQGIGRKLVDEITDTAVDLGLHSLFCHARIGVEAFYQQLGFSKVGPEFLEVGIRHQKMLKPLFTK
jgi:predicted GNAT family N-acyltransferase